MPNTLIIGYGNQLRGDDGFGWRVTERLRAVCASPQVEILSLHQLTPELMEDVSRADHVIFIDAAVGSTPGEIRERTVKPGAAAAFTHQATPEALLSGALKLYGKAAEVTMITVTGEDFSLSEELSPTVAGQVEAVVAAVSRMARRP